MMLSEIHLPKSRVFRSGKMSEVLLQQIKKKRKIAEIINKSISSFFFITNMKKHPNEEIRILEV